MNNVKKTARLVYKEGHPLTFPVLFTLLGKFGRVSGDDKRSYNLLQVHSFSQRGAHVHQDFEIDVFLHQFILL